MKLLLLVVVLFVDVLFVDAVPGREVQTCFDGSSFIKYNVMAAHGKAIGSTSDEITLQFRSSDASGLLLYADSRGLYGDHVLLELVNGKLRIVYQLGQNETLKEDIIGDGLGDNILSTVTVTRDKKKVTVSAYGGQSDKKVLRIPGADDRLDLNGDIYIGGYLNPKQDYPSYHRVNFKGCMIKAVFNKIDLLYGARRPLTGFSKSNVLFTTTPNIPPRSMNFKKETYMEIRIQKAEISDSSEHVTRFYGSFAFRTTVLAGTIFQASAVALTFQVSQLVLESGSTDLVAISFPNSGRANDGRWFEVTYSVTNTKMILTLNDISETITPSNRPQFGDTIRFGYDKNKFRFVGCIRDIFVQGNYIDYHKVIDPYQVYRIAKHSELSEGCKASDPCIPNPCFHEAKCESYPNGINCDCKKKYDKPLCQFSQYKTTCSAYKKDGGDLSPLVGRYFIDPDDSGPEPPVQVTCDFVIRKDVGQTEIETTNAEKVEISNPRKWRDRFSYKKEIEYAIPLTSVEAIVDRSRTCEQYVKYECLNAKLFNQPGGIPSSRWLSANGYLQYYWGGAPHDSYKCACAFTEKRCKDTERFCNCDSAAAEGIKHSDEGLLNVTRDLPVREVQFGGLDSLSSAKYTVRKIVCYGVDTLGVVTFVAPDGWLRLDPWDSPIGGDISFYIKTVFNKGSLIDHRNSDETHFFLVRIEDARTIAVVFSLGTSIRTTYLARMEKGLGTLSDNKWHKIHVIRTLWKMSVKIDDRPTTVPDVDEIKHSIDLSGDARSRLDIELPMFVGAFWRFPIYKKGYVGCMKGFTVNGNVIDLANAVDHLTHEPETLVLKGCGNACKVNQCPYGKCVEKYTSYSCDCSDVPFYGKYCNQENGLEFMNSDIHSSEINVTTGSSKSEKMVLAFSTKRGSFCQGTLFEIVSKNLQQYYKLVLVSHSVLQFEFKLDFTRDAVKIKISVNHVQFCDTNRHIVFFERNSTNWIKYTIDGRPVVEKQYDDDASPTFKEPYFFYVGNNKRVSSTQSGQTTPRDEGGQFTGCISGGKFHLTLRSGLIKTVEPIMQALHSGTTGMKNVACGPSINTPRPMSTRVVPGPTTPTDYPSTEFLRDFGIHEAEDSNWAVLIVVALLMMLCLVALVVLTIWFIMHHKNDYQILEKEDGTVVGTATIRGGNASLASVPAGAGANGGAASQISQGNLSRAKSKSNDVFV